MSADAVVQELLKLNQSLLESIAAGDWRKYTELCATDLTAFEPESRGQLVAGLGFHQFYFELGASGGPVTTTMSSPHVRMLGPDAAVVTYVRLTQRLDAAGAPVTGRAEESRVWQRINGCWRHVHFHRSTTA